MPETDAGDKPLADAVRHAASLMRSVAETLDKPVLVVAVQQLCVFLARETQAQELDYTLLGLTCQEEELGDWQITVKRLKPAAAAAAAAAQTTRAGGQP